MCRGSGNGNTQSCGCLKKDCNLFEAREEYYIGYTKDNQEFLISKEDYPTVSKHCWCIDNRGYFCTNIGNEMVSLHRFILKVKNNEIVDHINRDKNDNTRENLRICTNSQNGMNSKKKINNTSGIIGVSWSKGNNCWRARIQKDGKEFLLGYYKNFDDAVLSRLKGEKEYYKEFAPQRHLFEQYNI